MSFAHKILVISDCFLTATDPEEDHYSDKGNTEKLSDMFILSFHISSSMSLPFEITRIQRYYKPSRESPNYPRMIKWTPIAYI